MRLSNRLKATCLLAMGMACLPKAFSKVVPNSLFNSNAVLQRNTDVPVWGTAAEGERVTVTFNGQTVNTTATNGKWMVTLKPMPAGGPYEMEIKGENTLKFTNVMVGDVWLCSGQSNMDFPLRAIRPINGAQSLDSVLKDAQNYPLIRRFKVPRGKASDKPIEDVNGKWFICDSITAKEFSAVAYFCIREVYKSEKIPVAIIQSAYGGTPVENWLDKSLLEKDPELSQIITRYEKSLADFPTKLEEYKAKEATLLAKYQEDSAAAVAQKKPLPRKPSAPANPSERGGVGGLYNTMIVPLVPYAIKGVWWYQGEANSSRGKEYRKSFPLMINNWRSLWKMGDKLPFYFVQIPGWKNHFPELKEAQLLTWKNTPNTAMVVAFDADDTLDVHPGNKEPIGIRLSKIVKALSYKHKIEYSGPVYESFKVKQNTVELTFSHLGSGLEAKGGGELTDFTIAGSDKVFVPAKAQIVGNKVVVTSDAVAKPEAVRYGWRLCPQGNLYNKEGLPASPFRTDVE